MNDNHSLWYLENIDVTNMLCPKKEKAGHVDKHLHRQVKKGEYIYLPEEHSDKMYFLTEGRVKIGTYNSTGKEITKAILGVGEVFGEMAILGEDKRRDFAIVMEDAEMCVLTVEDMKALMRENSKVSMFMFRIMGDRTRKMERRLESLVFKDSRTRIVEFLHELALEKGRRIGYEQEVRNFITHQEIANLTATSRQTVTTVLNELRNKNILVFNRRRMLVRDMDLLAREAEHQVNG
ncbi:MAG: Crp/Fnr family transcriptional regulator [Saprospiraceae bacterium]|nr:Crp/Fnr family transcriptional regulator [Saprospiraceae bacterium]MCB9324088.1 Crp/Fnr family transcriptional regulator [Lewinellaceae bacterium]